MPKVKKEKKDKKVVEVAAEPSKLMRVIFRVPTSVAYESVEVEISGVADNTELVQKYNELVDIFRPKPKAVAPKEPFKPYSVPRVVPPADDEAGGAVIKDEVDEDTVKLQKQDIAALLERNHNFVIKGKSADEVADKVFEITKFPLVRANYENIIEKLKV